MKKIFILIGSLFLITVYPNSSLAYDFEAKDPTIRDFAFAPDGADSQDESDDESGLDDLFDDFGNTGDEFDIFDSDNEAINGTMYMEGRRLDSDIFQLSVMAKEMTVPVLGTAFHLLYEKDILAFLRYEPGDFLERGGDPFYLVKNDEVAGKVVFGETLRRNDSFPVGDGTIAMFYFQILDGEQFNFEFKNGVISTLDTVRQDIDLISWQNLGFDKNDVVESVADSGEASVLDSGGFNFSSIWVVVAMFISAIPASYLIIRLIKKYQKFKISPQNG